MRALDLWLAGALAATALGQQVVTPSTDARHAVVATKDGLVLPAGEFTVVELVDAVANYLCRNYLYDGNQLQQAQGFRLHRPIALDALGSEELLYALLSTRNFAVLPLDELRGVYQVVALDPNQQRHGFVASTPWRTTDEVLRRRHLREIVMTAVELQSAEAQPIANMLRGAFALQGSWQPGVLLASASDRRTLMLHGYRDQVAQAILLAQRLDRLSTPIPAPLDPVLQRLAALEREVADLRRQLGEPPPRSGDAGR